MSDALPGRVAELRRQTVDRVPGRLAALIGTRVGQLLDVAGGAASLPDDLDEAERAVLDVTEQFVVDVHGLTDDQVAVLGRYYSDAEQVAIMFHLALTDGFGKLAKVDGDWPPAAE